MKRLSPFALPLVLAAGLLAAIPDATGCAPVPRLRERVETSDEGALIVWDEKIKTEHFIRRANFRSTGYDFGFLVPTPNRPELDIANDDLFSELASITAAKVEHREVVQEEEKEFAFGCASTRESFAHVGAALPASKADRPGGVEVLEQKRVGDYDATVLAFRKGDGDTPERGAAELEKWLITHSYESPPAVKAWLAKYVQDGWCITAFKIAAPIKKDAAKKDEPKQADANPSGTRRDLRAKPIRMSFKADRPFYPYREPAADPATAPANESRLLRVFFAANVRYAGKLGDGSKPWPGQTVWSGPVGVAHWSSIFQQAGLTEPEKKDGKPGTAMPTPTEGFWLTEFEDRSSPRPGTDEVYFEPSADLSAVERPPIIVNHTKTVVVTPWWHLAVYIGAPVLLVLGGLGIWRLASSK
jgi:hypothetical protein